MNLADLAPWISSAIAAAALLYAVFGNRAKAHAQKISAIETSVAAVHNDIMLARQAIEMRVDRLEDRVTRTESQIEHMPDKEVTHRLEMTVGELRGDVKALTESIKPIRAIADRVQEAILDRVASA